VHNPYKLGYSAGGSSSGCAALVGAGEIEMAIGGDQGGSIRMPGSFSGVYGMKPTHGLVPYTGTMPIEATIDHVGPMTGTVADNALLLEVIAGPDGLDPRQYNVRVDKYTAALGRGVAGMRIGVLTEGFQHASCEPDVVQKVRQAADRLRSLGAIVEEISIPMHVDGLAIWQTIALESIKAKMPRQRHGLQLGGPVHDEPARRARQLARARQPALAHAEDLDARRRVLHPPVPRPLLREGAEPVASPQEDLRPGADAPRPAADADDADEGDADPAAGRAARALLPARVRDAAQHGAVRRQRPSGDERPVCDVGGAAGRHAAGRRALRGVDDLPRRARVRAARRLGSF
jgi:Asp-tRNA(Asn)/Glu-tRNA(Gln) amidotransferase A subunit family amidase